MEFVWYFIAGLAVAALGAYLALRSIRAKAEAEKRAAVAKMEAEVEHARHDLELAHEDVRRTEERERKRYDEMLRAQKEAQQQAANDLEKRHELALNQLKEQLENETKQLLEKRQDEFQNQSSVKLQQLLDPLKRDLITMRESVDKNKERQIQLQTSMETRIGELLKQTSLTAESANKLADALKNRGKVHGDWGETVLEEILEESGLREGEEYEKQSNVRDDDANLRPDIIIHFPEGKNMVIDSKASLTAYAEALSAETDEERKAAVKRHSKSVRDHVKELTTKRYQDIVDNAMQYVLMFIPNEGAYVMALNDNPKLLQEAYREGVIIVNPTNLMMTLHLVLIAWQQTRQEDNCRLIIQAANGMYEKMITVVDSFTTLGNQLHTVQKTYDEGIKQLSEGRGNLLGRIESLKELGVTSTKKRTKSICATTKTI